MKQLPSKLYPVSFDEKSDYGCYDIIPTGYDYAVNIYLGDGTTANDDAVKKSAEFFDKLPHWDVYCRELLMQSAESTNDTTVKDYFEFHLEELPEVFKSDNPTLLSLSDMIAKLQLKTMASHGKGKEQQFVVDFDIGTDELLCVYFDCMYNGTVVWES